MKKYLALTLTCGMFFLLVAQPAKIVLTQLATGYVSPVDLKHCGDERLFVVEQTGFIRILLKDGTKISTPFLDIQSRTLSAASEQGLLGLAFSPNYKQDGYFYVNYTTGSGNGSTRISRFSVLSTDSNRADPNSEVILLTIPQPYNNHNGGNLMFGKDGYLYVSLGDGGSGNDPQGFGQNKNSLLGKMLRINVSNQTTYSIPPDNPFVGQANVRQEIWAYGLRNAWRCSFDRLTGDMWLADVGQNAFEEINFQPANSSGGENYGWVCREGFLPTPPPANLSGCSGISGLTDPIHVLSHASNLGCSVTGGYVYRGAEFNALFGKYIFTDFCNGIFWSIKRSANQSLAIDSLSDLANFRFASFGEDNLGELYVTFRQGLTTNGAVFRIKDTSDCKPVAFVTFSDTLAGCAPLSLSALEGSDLAYQWFFNDNPIAGADARNLNATQSGFYKVRVTKNSNGCFSFSDSVYVNITDTTILEHGNAQLAYCNTDSSVDLSFYVQPAGGVFSGSAISGSNFVVANALVGVNPITYTFTNIGGCVSKINFSVLVGEPTPLSKNVPSTIYCTTDTPFSLIGYVSPAGGVFTGDAVAGNNFNPSLAGMGNAEWVYYTYTNTFGCVSMDSFSIAVDECNPPIGIGESSQMQVKVFPNPFTEKLMLIWEETAADVKISIYDARGGELSCVNIKGNETVLNLSELHSGVYTLRVSNKGQNFFRKVIKH